MMATSKRNMEKMPAAGGNGSAREALLELRRRIMKEISSRGLSYASPAENSADVVDQAVNEQDRGLSLLLTGREKSRLQAVQEALGKMDDGTYGTCEDCGEAIGAGRLKAMPLAKLCVSCQSQWERELKSRLEEEAEPDLPPADGERGLEREEE